MIWCMEILRVYLEKQLLITYYVIKHLTLLKVQNIMDIKELSLHWFIKCLIKILLALILVLRVQINLHIVLLKVKLCKTKN